MAPPLHAFNYFSHKVILQKTNSRSKTETILCANNEKSDKLVCFPSSFDVRYLEEKGQIMWEECITVLNVIN